MQTTSCSTKSRCERLVRNKEMCVPGT